MLGEGIALRGLLHALKMQHGQNDQILPIGFPILMILLTQRLSPYLEKEALAHVDDRFGAPHLSQRRQWPVSIGAAVP
jgi:hypothetical protein